MSECEKVLANSLEAVIEFWGQELEDTSTPEQRVKFEQIKSIVTDFEAFVVQRLEKYKSAIEGIEKNNSGVIVDCPDCDSSYFAVFKSENKKCKCFICDSQYSKDNYLNKIRTYEDSRKHSSLFPFEPYETNCHSCGSSSVVRYVVSDDVTLYLCLQCLNKEKHSKSEQRTIEFKEWVAELESKHTNEEIIEILNNKLAKYDDNELAL